MAGRPPGPVPGCGAEQRPARRRPHPRQPRSAPLRSAVLGPRAPYRDAGVSPTAALRHPLRRGAPAARGRDARESREPCPRGKAPPLFTSRLSPRLPAPRGAGGGGRCSASPEFAAVQSRRPLGCLPCNLLLLILAVSENSSLGHAAEPSSEALQNRDGGHSRGVVPPGRGSPHSLGDTFALLGCGIAQAPHPVLPWADRRAV